jgi:hypothetical protein
MGAWILGLFNNTQTCVVIAGVVFNTIFPEWLQVVLLTLLLVPVVFNTFRKAIKLRTSEEKERARGVRTLVPDGHITPPVADHDILGVCPCLTLLEEIRERSWVCISDVLDCMLPLFLLDVLACKVHLKKGLREESLLKPFLFQ